MKYYPSAKLPCLCFDLHLFVCLHWVVDSVLLNIRCVHEVTAIERKTRICLSFLKDWPFLTAHVFTLREQILTWGKHIIQNYKQREASLKLFSLESLTAVKWNMDENILKFQHFSHSLFISLSHLPLILSRKDVSTNYFRVLVVRSIFLAE